MPNWNELFTQPKHRWLEPHEKVVEFAERFPFPEHTRILDLGCGSGRHTVYLASQGFQVSACDISENGLAYTHDWLVREGLTAQLDRMDMTELKYPDETFDGVISLFVVYHNPLEKIRLSLAEIYRVLNPGGRALLTFISKRGYRYGHGEQVEPDTFISVEGDDEGELHHFSDLTEFDREFKAFIIQKVELIEEVEAGNRHSHWVVLAQRPEEDAENTWQRSNT